MFVGWSQHTVFWCLKDLSWLLYVEYEQHGFEISWLVGSAATLYLSADFVRPQTHSRQQACN